MKRLALDQPCPCGGAAGNRPPQSASQTGRKLPAKSGSLVAYGRCCGPWLEADSSQGPFAADAQQLMRSRYSAFVLEREAYLLATWQASQRPAVVGFDAGVKWLGLEVRDFRSTSADTAEVEFVARQKPAGGPATRLHERSRFVREGGRWFYLDGEQLPPRRLA